MTKSSSSTEAQDQQHPQGQRDRPIVEQLLKVKKPKDRNLAELARLKIRYHGFPGARDIQTDLERVLQQWDITEDRLFERTRKIHKEGKVYKDLKTHQETQQEDLS